MHKIQPFHGVLTGIQGSKDLVKFKMLVLVLIDLYQKSICAWCIKYKEICLRIGCCYPRYWDISLWERWIRGSVKGLKYPTGGLQYTWGLTRSDMNIWTPLGAGQSWGSWGCLASSQGAVLGLIPGSLVPGKMWEDSEECHVIYLWPNVAGFPSISCYL